MGSLFVGVDGWLVGWGGGPSFDLRDEVAFRSQPENVKAAR